LKAVPLLLKVEATSIMTELSPKECPSHLCQFTPKYSSISIVLKRVPVKDSAIADVSIGSADGKVFHLQRKYLEATTGGFPSAEFDTQGELIHLTESSIVLEALFRFSYPIKQPDLEDASFEVIAAVAEAAEKYEVFSAMNFCRLRMRFVQSTLYKLVSLVDMPRSIIQAISARACR